MAAKKMSTEKYDDVNPTGNPEDLFDLFVGTFDQNNKTEQYVGVDERSAICEVSIRPSPSSTQWQGANVMVAEDITLWVNVKKLPDRVAVLAPDNTVGSNKFPPDGWFPVKMPGVLKNMPNEIITVKLDIRTGLFANLAIQEALSNFSPNHKPISIDSSNVDAGDNNSADVATQVELDLRVTCSFRPVVPHKNVVEDQTNRKIVFDIID